MSKLTKAEVDRITTPGTYTHGEVPGLYLRVQKNGTKRWWQDLRWRRERHHQRLGDHPAIDPDSVEETAKRNHEGLRQTTTPEEARKYLDGLKPMPPATTSARQLTAKDLLAALGELVDNTETKMKELSEQLDRVEGQVNWLVDQWKSD